MEQLRRLLKDAYDERATITNEISSAALEANAATNRYQKWKRGCLMKRIRKASFAARKEAADTAAAKLEELQEQLRLTTLATEIAVDPEQAEPYHRMRDEFAALSECQKIWNVLTEQVIDRIVERSTANMAITRDPVTFSLGSCDLIQWEQKVPHLPNRTGGDMYVYPGFVLYRASKQAFALIDLRDVSLRVVPTQFTEAQTVPPDTQVVGQTWVKSNKDGSPDRRFQNNNQLPVVNYSLLLFTSPDGLDVRYLCSNAALADRFARAWAVLHLSFSQQSGDESQAEQAQGNIDRVEIFRNAYDKFNSAHDTFNKRLMSIAGSGGKGFIERGDFAAYMASVAELIAAAKGCMEIPDALQLPNARMKLHRAVDSFEVARAHFEKRVYEGRMDPDSVTVYYDEVGRFLDATAEFWETLTSGGTKGRTRGAPAN
jgi:hypothetical protein